MWKLPGLEGKESIGERSTMETVLSVPQAQPHNQARSDFARNVLVEWMPIGFAMAMRKGRTFRKATHSSA